MKAMENEMVDRNWIVGKRKGEGEDNENVACVTHRPMKT